MMPVNETTTCAAATPAFATARLSGDGIGLMGSLACLGLIAANRRRLHFPLLLGLSQIIAIDIIYGVGNSVNILEGLTRTTGYTHSECSRRVAAKTLTAVPRVSAPSRQT